MWPCSLQSCSRSELGHRQEYDTEHWTGDGLQLPCCVYLSLVHHTLSLRADRRSKGLNVVNETDHLFLCLLVSAWMLIYTFHMPQNLFRTNFWWITGTFLVLNWFLSGILGCTVNILTCVLFIYSWYIIVTSILIILQGLLRKGWMFDVEWQNMVHRCVLSCGRRRARNADHASRTSKKGKEQSASRIGGSGLWLEGKES